MSAPSSPSGPDQRLAERIGQLRAEDIRLEAAAGEAVFDDDLARLLLAYRRSIAAEVQAPSPERSERLWARIEADLGDDADAPARTDRAPVRRERSAAERLPAWRYAVAAVLLVAVGVLAWWTLPADRPALVAQATTEIVTYETDAGSTVRLRPNSELYRVASDTTRRFRLRGEAAFDVATRGGTPFEVEAGAARVRVLGTRFTVQTWTTRPVVFLQEGRVALTNTASGRTAVLQPGESGTLTAGGDVQAQPAEAAPYVDWLDGQITFTTQPAADVADELEQHYRITIQLPDTVATQTITGRLLLDAQKQALDDFGAVLGGRFVLENGTYRFRGAAP
jgi:transmembrane sensor